jgi:subtilisin family serine protease
VKIGPRKNLDRALARFRADPTVAVAEPNEILSERFVPPPNDSLFGEQWGLDNTGQPHHLGDSATLTHAGTAGADVSAPEAWNVTQGDPATVIAIVDVGVDTDHEDLQTKIWTNTGEILGNGIDDDSKGYKDDVHGWDFVGRDKNTDPGDGSADDHGTFVAGVAAAATDNSKGVAGMCPQCTIMPLRVHTLAQWINALKYAKDNGADVVNMSLGGYRYSRLERNAISAARNSFLLVVAADNFSLDNDLRILIDTDGDGFPDTSSPAYPGVYTLPNILHVAASNDMDRYGYATRCAMPASSGGGGNSKSYCAFTNWGHDSVDLAAPGVDIASTKLLSGGNDYGYEDGTSFSAPLVAGIAGLVKSANPSYTPVQLRNVIMNTVDHPPALRTMYTALFRRSFELAPSVTRGFTRTNGRANAADAVAPGASTANAVPLTDGNVNGAHPMSKSKVWGSVAFPGDDNDVWSARLYKGRRYRIMMNGKDGQDFDLWIWKPGTTEIFQNFSTGSSSKLVAKRTTTHYPNVESVTFTPHGTGRFYFQVEAWLKQAGGYSLRVARV